MADFQNCSIILHAQSGCCEKPPTPLFLNGPKSDMARYQYGSGARYQHWRSQKQGKISASRHIYVYAVELKLVQDLGVHLLKIGFKLYAQTGPGFSLFSHMYRIFWVYLKTQIVSICAKIVFSQNCRDVKHEVFEKIIAFVCLSFSCRCKRQN